MIGLTVAVLLLWKMFPRVFVESISLDEIVLENVICSFVENTVESCFERVFS